MNFLMYRGGRCDSLCPGYLKECWAFNVSGILPAGSNCRALDPHPLHTLSLSKSSFKEITQISALENRLVCGALSPVSHQRRDNWDLAVLVDPRLQVLQRVQRRIVEAKWVGLNGVVEGLLEGVVLKL